MNTFDPRDPEARGTDHAGRPALDLLAALWRWRVLFVVVAATVPVAVAVLRSWEPEYRAATLLQVQQAELDANVFTPTLVPSQAIGTAARLVRITDVARSAERRLAEAGFVPARERSQPGRIDALLDQITVTPDRDAGFLTIAAVDPDPKRAIAVANAFGSAFDAAESRKGARRVDRTIAQARRDLSRIPDTDPAGRRELRRQLEQLAALRTAAADNVVVVERATQARAVSGSVRIIALSIVAGLMLGIAAVLAAQRLDRRIRTPEEYEAVVEQPLLAVLPMEAFGRDGLGSAKAFTAADMMRGWLMYAAETQDLGSVVVTSAGQEDGKTAVATHLALSVARAGKRVILVDADLRHPQVCARLGIEPTAGLSAVLLGTHTLPQVLRRHAPEGVTGTPLWILPAGEPPPNPSELLASDRMQTLVSDLESLADLVVIDTPAALAVSDALPLFRAAAGVVLVARIGRSTRDGARRALNLVTGAGGHVLGGVVTGATGGGAYGYGYGSYGSHVSNGARPPDVRGARAVPDSEPSGGTR